MKRGLIQWNKDELSLKEFHSRIEKTKDLMESKDIDALAIYGDAYQAGNLSYLTNFFPYADTGIFLLPAHDSPRLFTTHAYRNIPWFNTITWIEDIICSDNIGEECILYLKSIGLPHKKVGLVQIRSLPFQIFKLYQDRLDCELVDLTEDFEEIRSVKSRSEMSLVDRASKIAVVCFRKIEQILIPGISGYDLAAEIERTGRGHGAMDLFCYIQADNSLFLSLPTHKKIEKMVYVELCVEYQGQWSKLGRTFVLDGSMTQLNKQNKVFVQLCHRTIKDLNPAHSPQNLFKRLINQLEDSEKKHRVSLYYNLGLEPYWGTHLKKNLTREKHFKKDTVVYLKVKMSFQKKSTLVLTDTFVIQGMHSLLLTSV